ncbi:MAG: DUF5357 family protein, partial [Pseudomonadota bacterium]
MNPLLALLNDVARKLIDIFLPKQPFSWQTVFWLSFLAWMLAWLSFENIGSDFFAPGSSSSDTARSSAKELVGATRVLFTMAWTFLTVAVGWFLANQKIQIPILAITLKPAIWVTSALTSIFLF